MEGLKLIYPAVLDYYQQSEVDSRLTTLSGNLVIYIDQGDLGQYNNLVTTSGDLTSWVLSQDYATYLQLTTTSGDILSRIALDYTTLQKLTTTSGDIIAQLPNLSGYATQTWVNVNFIDATEMTTISGDIVSAIPNMSGYATESWVGLNFVDNAEVTTVSGDIVSWVVVQDYVSTSILTTVSGDIVATIPETSNLVTQTQLSTTSGNIMFYVDANIIAGSGIFYVSGFSIVHNLDSMEHFTTVTPGGPGDFDPDLVSSVGNIWIKKGTTTDIVYMTGDPSAEGITFDWQIRRY